MDSVQQSNQVRPRRLLVAAVSDGERDETSSISLHALADVITEASQDDHFLVYDPLLLLNIIKSISYVISMEWNYINQGNIYCDYIVFFAGYQDYFFNISL